MIKVDIPNAIFRQSDYEEISEESLYFFEINPDDYWLEFKLCENKILTNSDDNFPVITGRLKWDGCMDWETNPICMYHFCSPKDVFDLAKMFDYLYSIGKEHITNWMD
jgi:hypothetical protein